IQNIFAVMGGLIGLSGRYHDDVGAFASTLQERIAALSRAHAFIRPDPETAAAPRSGSLKDLLRFLALPYTAAANEVRIRVEG
ncbi:HWE histidine kinase domain-containing protein, partial [Shewanella algae]|uniref:HWE histidine kinase domain-containing protein n=1 Tax=Shewanella algae TaxID=38313 RepID=UPI00313D0C92